jgi:predicted metal-dependent hydrolase
MDNLLRTGIKFFNKGLYYEAHESWEDLWRLADTDARIFCQGLVQVAVGLHHVANGNSRGGNRVLARGLGNLETFPDLYMELDNASLVRDIHAVLENRSSSPIHIHCP